MSLPKKIKICFVVTKGVWGGAQKYVYNLATELSPIKYDVVVLAGEGEALKERLEGRGVRVISIESMKRDMSLISEIKSFFVLLSIIINEKPDVLHLNSPKAGGLGAFIGRLYNLFKTKKNKLKVIFTVHGWTFNESRSLPQNILILLFSWFTVFLCHKVIVISPKDEDQAKTMPLVNPRKIVLIRNGIEKVSLLSTASAKEEILKIANATAKEKFLWLGTIAELHKNKGLDYSIEAAKRLKVEFRYFILGEGEERKRLEYLIEKNNLNNKVILLGSVSDASKYLKAFDIFMLTSIKEGSPYTILEAGLAKLPVIASSVGGIPDIIDNGKSGILVTKGKSGEISRALEYLIDNPEKRKFFAENLKQKIESDFSLPQMFQKTEKLYLE